MSTAPHRPPAEQKSDQKIRGNIRPPRYLTTTDGRLWRHPAAIDAVIRCGACQCLLVRAETGWCCPASLDHTRTITDAALLERLTEALASWRARRAAATGHWHQHYTKPARVLYMLLRRDSWMARLGLTEAAIARRRARPRWQPRPPGVLPFPEPA